MKEITYSNVEIQINADGTTTQSILDSGTDIEDAKTAYYNSMWSMRSAVDAGTIAECTGFIVNSWGSVEMPYSEHYVGKEVPVNETV